MKSSFLRGILALLILALLPVSAMAGAHTVSSGSDLIALVEGTTLQAGDTITLNDNIKLPKMLVIKTNNVTLDLKGKTITAADSFYSTYANDSHLVQIGDEGMRVSGVTIKNGSLVTTTQNKHVLNVFQSDNVVLDNLSVDNTDAGYYSAPIVINNSTVTVQGKLELTLGDTSWAGVNLDPKVNGGVASLSFVPGSSVEMVDPHPEDGRSVVTIDNKDKGTVTVPGASAAGLQMAADGTYILAPITVVAPVVNSLPQTGDNASMLMWAVLCMAAVMGLGLNRRRLLNK